MGEHDSDAALWLEAVSGTERAFITIFDRYRTRIFRAAYSRVANVADAEEVVAIVFLEAWRLRERVRVVDGSLLPWLLAVTSNVAANLVRSRRRYSRMLAQLPAPSRQEDHAMYVEERLDRQPLRHALADALGRLSPGDRAVAELCLIEELPLSSVAAALELPIGTVKSRLHRARNQLRTALRAADISLEPTSSKRMQEGEWQDAER